MKKKKKKRKYLNSIINTFFNQTDDREYDSPTLENIHPFLCVKTEHELGHKISLKIHQITDTVYKNAKSEINNKATINKTTITNNKYVGSQKKCYYNFIEAM